MVSVLWETRCVRCVASGYTTSCRYRVFFVSGPLCCHALFIRVQWIPCVNPKNAVKPSDRTGLAPVWARRRQVAVMPVPSSSLVAGHSRLAYHLDIYRSCRLLAFHNGRPGTEIGLHFLNLEPAILNTIGLLARLSCPSWYIGRSQV